MEPLEFQNLQICLVIRAFRSMNREIFFTNPTPLMFAHITYHIRAPTIFLHSDAASLAHAHLVIGCCPLLVSFLYFLLACFVLVRRIQALETVCLGAGGTLDIGVCVGKGWLGEVAFTVWGGTPFEVGISVDFSAVRVLNEFLIELMGHDVFLKVFS